MLKIERLIYQVVIISLLIYLYTHPKPIYTTPLNSSKLAHFTHVQYIPSVVILDDVNVAKNTANGEINYMCHPGRNKTYMSYKAITNKNSEQYKYIEKYMTVNTKGFLIDEHGRIGVALGSHFGKIGSKYDIELSNGNVLRVVKIEHKSDKHTNNGCEQKWDKSVIEFVIDIRVAKQCYGVAKNGYINSGNYNNVDEFKGDIIKINKIESRN